MMRARLTPVLPGATLGLLGGGQLARMTALAARGLGYRVHVLDPDPDCPARSVCDSFVHGSLDDVAAATQLARAAQVVTCEREDVSAQSLQAVERITLLRPGGRALELLRDRAAQKQWLIDEGFPVTPFRVVSGVLDMLAAMESLGGRMRLRGRHAGLGAPASSPHGTDVEDENAVLAATEGVPLVAEWASAVAAELAVMVARSPNGATRAFPVASNQHREGLLETSVMPAMVDPALHERAVELAVRIATKLELVGLLAVELSCTRAGELQVDRLVPRPHGSFHLADHACAVGQFEQLVRAVTGLPLGDAALARPAALANLYGDLWLQGRAARLPQLVQAQGVSLCVYDKPPHPRRKLGHLACTADTPEAALRGVERALYRLHAPTTRIEPPLSELDAE